MPNAPRRLSGNGNADQRWLCAVQKLSRTGSWEMKDMVVSGWSANRKLSRNGVMGSLGGLVVGSRLVWSYSRSCPAPTWPENALFIQLTVTGISGRRRNAEVWISFSGSGPDVHLLHC
jgi:hypothetical protein